MWIEVKEAAIPSNKPFQHLGSCTHPAGILFRAHRPRKSWTIKMWGRASTCVFEGSNEEMDSLQELLPEQQLPSSRLPAAATKGSGRSAVIQVCLSNQIRETRHCQCSQHWRAARCATQRRPEQRIEGAIGEACIVCQVSQQKWCHSTSFSTCVAEKRSPELMICSLQRRTQIHPSFSDSCTRQNQRAFFELEGRTTHGEVCWFKSQEG